MADISAFPTIRDVLKGGQNTQKFTAGAAVKAGQVVGFAATGVSMTLHPMDATSGEKPVGVALYDAAIGDEFAVCMPGTVAKVANADASTGIDAGDYLETNDNAVKGTVSAVDVAATGGATVTCHFAVIGIALDDIAGGGTGRMLVWPLCVVQPNTS